MPDALVIKNSDMEGPGILANLLESDGFNIRHVRAWKDVIPDNLHDILIVLGGPQGANDRRGYLRSEEDIIRYYAEEDIPVLGICLGAQLAARALGGRVTRGPEAEAGFYSDLVPAGDSRLLAGFESPFHAFHWHRDTFDIMPAAERLAGSRLYKNQAFRSGSVVGLQFHLEADAGMIRRWLADAPDAAALDAESAKIEADIGSLLPAVTKNMRLFYENYMAEFFPR